jgi:hypothetical protein
MDKAAYQGITQGVLQPRVAKLRTIQARVATDAHPWATAIMQAYNDLNARCEKASNALQTAASKGDMKAWTTLAPAALDRYMQAMSMAQALTNAGYGGYLAQVSRLYDQVAHLGKFMQKSGLSVAEVPRFWPVNTPDGWLWVTDYPYDPVQLHAGIRPVVLEQGKPAKEPLQGEPVLADWELANVLASVELAIRQKEAV